MPPKLSEHAFWEGINHRPARQHSLHQIATANGGYASVCVRGMIAEVKYLDVRLAHSLKSIQSEQPLLK